MASTCQQLSISSCAPFVFSEGLIGIMKRSIGVREKCYSFLSSGEAERSPRYGFDVNLKSGVTKTPLL